MKDQEERSWKYRRERILIIYSMVEAGFVEMLIYEHNLEGSDVYGKVVLAEGTARADTLMPQPAECIQRTAKRLLWLE